VAHGVREAMAALNEAPAVLHVRMLALVWKAHAGVGGQLGWDDPRPPSHSPNV